MVSKGSKNNTSQGQPSINLGFGGILEGIQKLVETATKLKDSGQISQTGEFNVPGLGDKGKGIFGFSIRTMADGDSGPGVKVRPFGNIHATKEGMSVQEDREPVVDVLEEGNQVRVIAELPGVSQAEIAFEVNGDVLTISTKGTRKYNAKVLLPGHVDIKGVKSSYNNGVFELRFEKIKG